MDRGRTEKGHGAGRSDPKVHHNLRQSACRRSQSGVKGIGADFSTNAGYRRTSQGFDSFWTQVLLSACAATRLAVLGILTAPLFVAEGRLKPGRNRRFFDRHSMDIQQSDESYIIDICDQLLEQKAKRQHRFEFLRGDPGRNGRTARLPVDAYYEDSEVSNRVP